MEGPVGEADAQRADLLRLAAELAARGYLAALDSRPGQQTYLVVRNPQAEMMAERVYADDAFFVWSWHQPVARRSEVTRAADVITWVLRTVSPG
jgi:hypothetical protein